MKPRFFKWFAGGLLLSGIAVNLAISLRAVASITEVVPLPVRETDALSYDAELLGDVVDYLATPEYKARAVAQEKRHREIELQLAAAKQQEEKQARYEASQRESVILDTPPGTPVYAFGSERDRVTVACSTSEFGQTAVMSSSLVPSRFFKAKYLQACSPGQYLPGDEIGVTVGELAWSEHEQASGLAIDPSRGALEMAVTGYTPGQYEAPLAEGSTVDFSAIAQSIKNKFSN